MCSEIINIQYFSLKTQLYKTKNHNFQVNAWELWHIYLEIIAFHYRSFVAVQGISNCAFEFELWWSASYTGGPILCLVNNIVSRDYSFKYGPYLSGKLAKTARFLDFFINKNTNFLSFHFINYFLSRATLSFFPIF